MKSKLKHLDCRDQNVFSKLTADEWRKYAGQVLAIDPTTDRILAVGKTEAEIEAAQQFSCAVVEFFHVPPAGSLSAK